MEIKAVWNADKITELAKERFQEERSLNPRLIIKLMGL